MVVAFVGTSVLPLLFDRWLVNSHFSRFRIGEDFFYSHVNKTEVEF